MDTFGRRSLLLATFPFLAIFQFTIVGFVKTKNSQGTLSTSNLAGLVTAMYLYCAFYSVGEGPVPFVSGVVLAVFVLFLF